MSTILKALRRLEDEKQARAAERDLREAVAARPADRASSGPAAWLKGALVGLLAALLLAALVAGGWWWASARDRASEVAAAPPPVAPAGRELTRTAEVAPAPSLPPQGSQRPQGAAEAPPAPPPVSAAPEPSPAGLSDDFAVVDPPRGPETDRAQVIELDRADASVLRVSSTVWHPSAARRSARVTLEGDSQPRELREGDEVGEFTVVAIEPTGVTFGRRGLRFHRKVGQR